jgi:hypothetical protein
MKLKIIKLFKMFRKSYFCILQNFQLNYKKIIRIEIF